MPPDRRLDIPRTSARTVVPAPGAVRALRVVLVDDSRALVVRMRAMLEGTGRIDIVDTAANVAGAIDQIERLLPDVVIVDVDLDGGENGISVLRHVVERHPDIAVLGFSNYGWEAMRHTWLQAGATAYFDKSLQFIDVRRWLEARADALAPPAGQVGTGSAPSPCSRP